jgi:hypothetical protein
VQAHKAFRLLSRTGNRFVLDTAPAQPHKAFALESRIEYRPSKSHQKTTGLKRFKSRWPCFQGVTVLHGAKSAILSFKINDLSVTPQGVTNTKFVLQVLQTNLILKQKAHNKLHQCPFNDKTAIYCTNTPVYWYQCNK